MFAGLMCFAVSSHAQFKEEAFQQSYNEEGTYNPADTTAKLFSFKEYFGGLAHKNTIPIANMFAGSIVLPGTAQIYNGDYWKLPIVYGGLGALAGTGADILISDVAVAGTSTLYMCSNEASTATKFF